MFEKEKFFKTKYEFYRVKLKFIRKKIFVVPLLSINTGLCLCDSIMWCLYIRYINSILAATQQYFIL
jgi:hypothetical protein